VEEYLITYIIYTIKKNNNMKNIKKFKIFTEGLETQKSWEYSQTVVDEKVKDILLKLIDESRISYEIELRKLDIDSETLDYMRSKGISENPEDDPTKPNSSIVLRKDPVSEKIDLVNKFIEATNFQNLDKIERPKANITLTRLLTKYLDSISPSRADVLAKNPIKADINTHFEKLNGGSDKVNIKELRYIK